jgi:hypothetical protein
MKRTLLTTTAAVALLAGISIASAQNPQTGGSTSGGTSQGGAMSQGGGSQSGGGAASETKGHGSSQMKSDEGGSSKGRAQAPATHKGNTAQSKEGQTEKRRDNAQSKEGMPERRRGETAQSRDRERTGQSEQRERTGQRERGEQRERMGQTERGRNGHSSERAGERSRESGNTGSTARSDTKLTTEQRTQVREHFGSSVRSRSIPNANFAISVGTVVPRSVHVYEVPADVVEIVPAYRGYKYVVVGDEILILNPRTLRIVAIIDA